MELKLTKNNIEDILNDYLEKVNSIKLPKKKSNLLNSLLSLKRDPIGSGPYLHVSLYEASNRIFSDLIILFGVRQLLTDFNKYDFRLPFKKYKVQLGVKGGFDLEATYAEKRLIGEAFNVAPSFFQSKKYSSKKRLEREIKADYRLIIFNAEAVNNPNNYIDESKPELFYLPVNITEELKDF